MKKFLTFLIISIMSFCYVFGFSACNSSQDITVKFLDDKLYTRYGDDYYYSYNTPISFEDYEKGNRIFKSRAYCYARLLITFNNAPDGYYASEVFQLSSVVVDDQKVGYSLKQEEESNEMEIILWFQYLTDQNEHCLNSISYKQYDAVINDYVEHDFELNYWFTITVEDNWIDRFNPDTKFNATKINEPSKQLLLFTVETNLDYDYIVYNVDRCHIDRPSADYSAIFTEWEMEKSDVYRFETSGAEYFYRTNFSIVGFKKDSIIYYISPISFYMDD